jgi:hypothetical protein
MRRSRTTSSSSEAAARGNRRRVRFMLETQTISKQNKRPEMLQHFRANGFP